MNRAWFAVPALLVACGGGRGADGGTGDAGGTDAGPADAGSTTITLTGARTGTLTGAAPTCLYTPAVNRGEVTASVNSSTDQTSFDFMFDGVPTTTSYVGDTDAGITCNIYDTVPATGDGWMANRGGGIPDLGACTVSLSSVSLLSDVGTQRSYTVHGSVTATLAPRSGTASSPITFSASF